MKAIVLRPVIPPVLFPEDRASPTRNAVSPAAGKTAHSTAVSDVTVMLQAVADGDPQGAEKLLPLVYEELRRVAAHRMARQPAGHTLQATALVHEAFLRLTGNPAHTWENRRHFFAAASEAMRHI